MANRPKFFIVESGINKEYFLSFAMSFAIIILTLVIEKTPLDQLTPWANLPRSPL